MGINKIAEIIKTFENGNIPKENIDFGYLTKDQLILLKNILEECEIYNDNEKNKIINNSLEKLLINKTIDEIKRLKKEPQLKEILESFDGFNAKLPLNDAIIIDVDRELNNDIINYIYNNDKENIKNETNDKIVLNKDKKELSLKEAIKKYGPECTISKLQKEKIILKKEYKAKEFQQKEKKQNILEKLGIKPI